MISKDNLVILAIIAAAAVVLVVAFSLISGTQSPPEASKSQGKVSVNIIPRNQSIDVEFNESCPISTTYVEVVDRGGNNLYNREFDSCIGSSKVSVPVSEINKSVYGEATIKVTVATGDGNITSSKKTEVPKYSDEELKEIYENLYLENSQESTQVSSDGGLKVSLVRFGVYKHFQGGREVSDFRADIKVENSGPGTVTLDLENTYVSHGGTNYGYSEDTVIDYSITCPELPEEESDADVECIDGSYVSPGETKSGYIVYDGLPAGSSGSLSINVGISYNIDTDSEKSHSFSAQL